MDIKTIILYALACLPAVLFWGFLYYKKNPDKLKLKTIIGTFLLGVFSLIPILLYQQFAMRWQRHLLTNYFVKELSEQPILAGLIEFAFTMLFIAVFVFILVALISLMLSLFRKSEFLNMYRGYLEETANFEIIAVIIGVIVIIETVVKIVFGVAGTGSILGVLMVMAVLEEYVKHLLVRIFNDHHLKSVDQAISFSIYVGLGFAFAENIFYLLIASQFSWAVLVGRSIFSTFGHLLFSALFGYYYGVAHFSHPITVDIESERHKLFELPKWMFKFIPVHGEKIFHTEKIIEGLLFAMGLHAIFNLAMAMQYVVAIPILFVGGYYVLDKIFQNKENRKNFGLIGTDVMPPGEYEMLITRINAIKWAQKIRQEREEHERKIHDLEEQSKWYRKTGRFSKRLTDYVLDEIIPLYGSTKKTKKKKR
jgi:RsiW-degrading membrane proteinase PrsW (M82 family)